MYGNTEHTLVPAITHTCSRHHTHLFPPAHTLVPAITQVAIYVNHIYISSLYVYLYRVILCKKSISHLVVTTGSLRLVSACIPTNCALFDFCSGTVFMCAGCEGIQRNSWSWVWVHCGTNPIQVMPHDKTTHILHQSMIGISLGNVKHQIREYLILLHVHFNTDLWLKQIVYL